MREHWFACLVAVALVSGAARGWAVTKSTFAVDYTVTISAKQPKIARVRWDLSGIDEIRGIRLRFPVERFDQFTASGKLEQKGGEVLWEPGQPYAHLSYRVRVDNSRGRQQRYDSYAASDWIITRAKGLFPRISVVYDDRKPAPKSRARLVFKLPSGWRVVTAMEAAAPDVFLPLQPGNSLDRPTGWMALGEIDVSRQEIGNTMVEVARVPGSKLKSAELFRLYEDTLPMLQKLLQRPMEHLLVVSGPDPMWHGGISGTDSFYIHGDRALRTPDKTSPYLHELFHVMQPYKPGPDADWIEEGLAEYYSLELQRRAGLLDAAAYDRGLGYLQRYGLWNVDMTKQQDNAATNNSAPFIMHAIDQRIQRATAGKQRLDDALALLLRGDTTVSTARFERAVEQVAGKTFRTFFRRHVREGEPPPALTVP